MCCGMRKKFTWQLDGENQMTVLDRIKEYDMEDMTEFLFRYARDVINQFGNLVMPNKENIEKFLKENIPGSD